MRKGVLALFGLTMLMGLSAGGQGFDWSDDATGPTCDNHLTMGALAWANRGGDWLDATGQEQGRLSFAAADVPEGQARQRVVFDVTRLMQGVQPGVGPSVTLMLRAEPSALRGQADFASREADDRTHRPHLDITLSDGSRMELAPAADTILDCTTVTSLGGLPVLSVRGNRATLLRFVSPGRASIAQATLSLTSPRQYAGGARVGVYRARMPGELPAAAPRLGIASRHLMDGNIGRDPAVIFATGFEGRLWPLQWRDISLRGDAEVVTRDPESRFEPLDGAALRVRLRRGTHLALDLRYHFGRHGVPEPEEAYLRYYLRLGDDWNPNVDGGKLPGLAGTYGRGGWGNRKADGRSGWSMRAAFAPRPPASSVAGLTALGSVACHARTQDVNCDHWGWGLGRGAVLPNNRWTAVEQHVKLNTPGKADGVFEAWLDGQLVYRNTTVVYRDVPDLRIESAWFNVYHGGTQMAPADMTLYIDNVVVAREYVGPMAGVVVPTVPGR